MKYLSVYTIFFCYFHQHTVKRSHGLTEVITSQQTLLTWDTRVIATPMDEVREQGKTPPINFNLPLHRNSNGRTTIVHLPLSSLSNFRLCSLRIGGFLLATR